MPHLPHPFSTKKSSAGLSTPAAPAAGAPGDSLIPDGCNAGVMFRVLVAVNGAVLASCLIAADGWRDGLAAFVESTILLEASTLASLMLLCGLRAPLASRPAWLQRLFCGLLPGLVTALLIYLLRAGAGRYDELTRLGLLQGFVCGVLAGALLQHYFELRTRAFSPALAEARLQALQARIRPHFLFNSLNAVLALIRSDPQRAESTLEDLADLFRVLMRDARDIISLEDEVRLCRQYLAIEQVRLGERLQIVWDLADIRPEVLRRAQVPALLLQPLLENAVHYGVEPALQPATVTIRLARSLDRIDITVINPLSEPTASGNHMALENIRERLALLHDVEGQLSTDSSNGHFEVRLRFPYVKAGA